MQKRNPAFEVRMETIPNVQQSLEPGPELDNALHTSFQHSDQRIRICKSGMEVLPILPEAFSVRQISPREKWALFATGDNDGCDQRSHRRT